MREGAGGYLPQTRLSVSSGQDGAWRSRGREDPLLCLSVLLRASSTQETRNRQLQVAGEAVQAAQRDKATRSASPLLLGSESHVLPGPDIATSLQSDLGRATVCLEISYKACRTGFLVTCLTSTRMVCEPHKGV